MTRMLYLEENGQDTTKFSVRVETDYRATVTGEFSVVSLVREIAADEYERVAGPASVAIVSRDEMDRYRGNCKNKTEQI